MWRYSLFDDENVTPQSPALDSHPLHFLLDHFGSNLLKLLPVPRSIVLSSTSLLMFNATAGVPAAEIRMTGSMYRCGKNNTWPSAILRIRQPRSLIKSSQPLSCDSMRVVSSPARPPNPNHWSCCVGPMICTVETAVAPAVALAAAVALFLQLVGIYLLFQFGLQRARAFRISHYGLRQPAV